MNKTTRKTKTSFLLHQINLQHSKKASLELNIQFSKLDNFLILSQEPYQYENRIKCLPNNTNILYNNPNNLKPRTCIIAHRNMKTFLLPQLSDQDTTVCSWELPPPNSSLKQVIIISSYWDINLPSIPQSLINAVNYCNTNNLPFIIGTDSNAHSTLWGSPNTDARGGQLEDFLIDLGIDLLNRGDTPTFRTIRASSIIDLTLCSPSLTTFITNWRIQETPSLSDHAAIQLNFTPTPSPPPLIRPYKKADWPLFRHLLTEWPPLPGFWTEQTINDQCAIFYDKVNSSLDQACPLQPAKTTTQLTWWNTIINNSRKNVHKSYHQFQKSHSQNKWDDYKTARRRHWRNIRKAKRESWKDFISGTDNQKTASVLSKIIQQKLNKATTAYLRHPDGSLSLNSAASAEILMNEHFPGNSPLPAQGKRSRPQIIPPLPWINVDLIKQAFHSFKHDKSAGPDNIKPIVLHQLPPAALTFLNQIYTACITLGHTPKAWATSKTVFIPKQGRNDYQDPRSYRPISLTPFLFKTLEKLMLWEANSTCLLNSPFHINQHAFRPNHSCDIAISKVTSRIEKSILNGQFTLGIFLDIQGAFDSITPRAVEAGMILHNFPPIMINWYINYITNRSCQVTLGHSSLTRFLTQGTPQGGVFSPIAWNLAFDSLLSIFDGGPTFAIGWADDGCLLISGPDPHTLADIAQDSINKAMAWAALRGLTFSHSKTKVILFSKKYNKIEKHLPPLRINNTPVPYSHSCLYLGITLTHNLSWKAHLNQKFANAKKSLLLHRNALGTLWGPSPHIVRWLYEGIIKPSLTYGCMVWGKSSETKSFKTQANKLQRLALLPMAPVRCQSPTAGLEIISNLIPLDIFIQKTATSCFNRIQHLLNPWDGVGRHAMRGHTHWLKGLLSPISLPPPALRDDLPTSPSPKFPLHINLNNFCDQQSPPPQTSITIFTDGSKTNSGIGSGVAVFQADSNNNYQPILTRSYHLPDHSTVFQAEIEAINQAATLALQITHSPDLHNLYGNLSSHSFIIISDSKAAILALSNRTHNSKTVLNCKTSLQRLTTSHPVTLHWIKAHAGHPGNELADQLAKAGSTPPPPPPGLPTNQPLLQIPFPKCYTKKLISNHFTQTWCARWKHSTPYRQTKIFFPEPCLTKSARLLRLSRDTFGMIARWLTGHCFLNRHNHLLDPLTHPTPTCHLCEMAEETPYHIICECEAVARIRYHHFQELFLQGKNPEWTVKKLLSFLSNPTISNLEITPNTD